MNRERLAQLLEEIKDPEYRRGMVEGHAKDTIAFQLRQLRKAKNWEQRDLAHALGNPKLQPMISRYEDPDYGRYTMTTLLELAAVFDVALVVRFAPFSELVEWDVSSTDEKLTPSPYAQDDGLANLSGATSGIDESIRSGLEKLAGKIFGSQKEWGNLSEAIRNQSIEGSSTAAWNSGATQIPRPNDRPSRDDIRGAA